MPLERADTPIPFSACPLHRRIFYTRQIYARAKESCNGIYVLVWLIQYLLQSETGTWVNHIFLGDAKMLQRGTPRSEIFKKLMYI